MYLTRHSMPSGSRWAVDGRCLPAGLSLSGLMELHIGDLLHLLAELAPGEPATGSLLSPVDPMQEVWASGVTYLRSREARQAESAVADVYTRVYQAERPELFFKAVGWRVAGHLDPIRVRGDSRWNVPEPEMTLVINRHGEIVGFCAGNDVSSRDIEGENPLYLPQAKIYNGSCALGPGIVLADAGSLADLPVHLEVARAGALAFAGDTRTSRIARRLPELAGYLCRELTFPHGVFLMTGTGIVPPDSFSLSSGDVVKVTVSTLVLENQVA